MAAEAKAATNEEVVANGAYSMSCRNRRLEFDSLVGQLKREFKTKLLEAKKSRNSKETPRSGSTVLGRIGTRGPFGFLHKLARFVTNHPPLCTAC
jgi:hypothetical protein